MIITVPLSKGNQITVPSALRKMLNLKPGESMAFDTDLRTYGKAETQEETVKRVFAELDKWRESLPQEVKDNIKKHAGWTMSQYHEHYDNSPEVKTYIKEKYGV